MTRHPAAFLLILILFLSGCAALRAQKQLEPAVDGGEFRNLQVLRANITRDSLIAVMQEFRGALGVGCDHCHAVAPGDGEPELDFASDAKPEKAIARSMLMMVREINGDYLEPLGFSANRVSCMTCHRGATIPSDAPLVRRTPSEPPGSGS